MLRYDPQRDTLMVVLKNGPFAGCGDQESSEVVPVYDEAGELIRVEIPRVHERLAGPRTLEGTDLPAGDEFWRERTLAELVAAQKVAPVGDLNEVLGGGAALWDSDEQFAEFVGGIRQRRQTGES